jgi:sorbitol-specific phosphotransferase system component IIBC
MATQINEPIFVGIDNERIELVGAKLAEFIADRERMQTEFATRTDAQTAKQVARQAVLDKLGLSADEAQALFG